ncbi:amylo-alpha-1,6-glucosidase [Pelagibius sp.]|uniref:amylo-alpha-1,6-glucosidase n=1 Tax=Pelagibius sp. TaxID=1931238 RepID=UPI00261DC58A|nr:trehalase family glycosidase [Pelagibius sp.]
MSPAGWSTWNPERPAELWNPETGFRVVPALYSAKANHFLATPRQVGLFLGARAIDGRAIHFDIDHYQTRLRWRFRLEPEGPLIEWVTQSHGEWGLRFWVILCVSGPEGSRLTYDQASGVLQGFDGAGELKLHIAAAKDPLLVTFHESLDALAKELENKGYFYLDSRGTEGRFAALRFNLEEAPALRVAVSSGTVARPDLPESADELAFLEPKGPQQACLQAIHDVMAWNHAFDSVNRRPYTLLTRNWNSRKFGGFGVWLNDVLYNALLWSLFDPVKARQNLEAVFAWQTEEGNFPCLVTGNDAWIDRSQPPIAAFVVWSLYARSGDRDLLDWAFPKILRNYDWWWRRRHLAESGLVAYGTSPDVGTGLYKGTKLGAKNESSMDNSPLHDPAPFDPESGLLLSADVGLNSLLALDGEILALIARALGRTDEAARLEAQVATHKARIGEQLWDAERGVFANRLLDGVFIDSLAPTSFFPLAAGIATPEQSESMISRYLLAPEKFGGPIGLPSVTRDDPAYPDNVYWRGRVWPPLNFWTYLGLRRAGRDDEAAKLAVISAGLFARSWKARHCGENFNAESGAILDQADSDAFYSWGALLPALALSEVIDLSPWSGLSLAPAQVEGEVGPLHTPLGAMTILRDGEAWSLLRNGEAFLASDLTGRISQLSLSADGFAAVLPAGEGGAWLRFEGRRIAGATLDGVPLSVTDDRIDLPPRAEKARLEVHFG